MLWLTPLIALAQASVAAPPPPAGGLARLVELPEEARAYVPANASQAAPVLVLLHGGDRRPSWMLDQLRAQADARGIVLLAPVSRGGTWDVIGAVNRAGTSSFGFDEHVAYRFSRSGDSDRVGAALAALARTVPIDPAHVVLAGFSDGATFALALGMARSQPFSAVIAWSPGIPIETSRPARGRRVFVSHGRKDPVLSYYVDCSKILPLLRNEGAAVTFMPFDGVHEVPKGATDAFLDAAFGPPPGKSPMPLPSNIASCPTAQ